MIKEGVFADNASPENNQILNSIFL
jgi:hypothetical protein